MRSFPIRLLTSYYSLLTLLVPVVFPDRHTGAATEQVLLWAAGAGDADGADDRHAVDDRQPAGHGQDLAAVRAVRKRIDGRAKIMVDYNQALSVAEALKRSRARGQRGHLLD